jgi:hypothetical protein
MMSKRGSTMLSIIVVFVVVGLFALAIGDVMTGFNDHYGGYDLTLTEGYDTNKNFTDITNEMQNQINSNDTNKLDTIAYTTRGSLSVMSLGLGTISMVGQTFHSVAATIGVKAVYVDVAIGIIFLTLILIFVSALVRWNLGGTG